MARGANSKEIITSKILEMFPGAFINAKEIRIPMAEDGAEVQIKVTLTAAKDNVANPSATSEVPPAPETKEPPQPQVIEPSAEELDLLNGLVKSLGL